MDLTQALLLVVILLLAVNLAVLLFRRRSGMGDAVSAELIRIYQEVTRVGQSVREESSASRHELEKNARSSREELNTSLYRNRTELTGALETIRTSVDQRLQSIQADNAKKLEEMRQTVDEKLQATVERRFSESFKLISDRLEQVHKGLGEMQTLAVGVGDLKKVLSNVKTRGTLGEIQLGAILGQILAPEQYQQNVAVRQGSQERVEFCVVMPGQGNGGGALMLPIDSKFPNEDYQRLLESYDAADGDLEYAAKQFEISIRKNAKTIADKYINPPHTTDFAIMFVPTEGLYAEIVRRSELFNALHRDLKVLVVGPTNLAALLNSLQMGFRTLAIEKRSSEVWEILGAVKAQFGKFGDILDKTKKKLVEATNTIDDASQRSRVITRQLGKVQELPVEVAVPLLENGSLSVKLESIESEES
jgi:DNA recombination protein RmuC